MDKSCVFFNNQLDYYLYLKSLNNVDLFKQYINNNNFVVNLKMEIFRYYFKLLNNKNDYEELKKYINNLPGTLNYLEYEYTEFIDSYNDVYNKYLLKMNEINQYYFHAKKRIEEINNVLNDFSKIIDIIESHLDNLPTVLKDVTSDGQYNIIKNNKVLIILEDAIIRKSYIDYDYLDFKDFFKDCSIKSIKINNEVVYKIGEGVKKIVIINYIDKIDYSKLIEEHNIYIIKNDKESVQNVIEIYLK